MSDRVLVISDLHLGRNFSPTKFGLIRQLVLQCDRLIINGDLWEGFGVTFRQFINSPWQKLFPLFKEKKTIYLFGNHDSEQAERSQYSLFCDRAVASFDFEQNGVKFHVIHGNYIDRTLDMNHPNLPKWLLMLGSRGEQLLITLFGRLFLNIYRPNNQRLKDWKVKNLPAAEWLIAGHTHLPELNKEVRYANSGSLIVPKEASCLMIEDGKVNLHYVNG